MAADGCAAAVGGKLGVRKVLASTYPLRNKVGTTARAPLVPHFARPLSSQPAFPDHQYLHISAPKAQRPFRRVLFSALVTHMTGVDPRTVGIGATRDSLLVLTRKSLDLHDRLKPLTAHLEVRRSASGDEREAPDGLWWDSLRA
jgi:hypothetical protein